MTQAKAPVGRFVWHDLMTTDVKKARGFYVALFGWKTQDIEMGGKMGTYTMVGAGDRNQGGLVPLGENENMPSHWIGYISTDDVDAAVKRVERMGGKACVPPTDIPNVGRFAVCSDTFGAVFSPFKSAQPAQPESSARPVAGAFCWDELLSPDPARAAPLYSEAFGWKVESHDMGPMGTYTLFNSGDKQVGGAMKKPAGQTHGEWLPYLAVDDVDTTAAQAIDLGARQHLAPKDIPGVGRLCVLADPTGASFAIFKDANTPR